MNLAQQRRLIAVSAMLVFALGFLSHAQKGELPTARFLIGAGGIFTLISIFADLGLPIGAGMALVVLITAILTEGEDVLRLLSNRGGFKEFRKPKPRMQRVAPGVTQRIMTPGEREFSKNLFGPYLLP